MIYNLHLLFSCCAFSCNHWYARLCGAVSAEMGGKVHLCSAPTKSVWSNLCLPEIPGLLVDFLLRCGNRSLNPVFPQKKKAAFSLLWQSCPKAMWKFYLTFFFFLMFCRLLKRGLMWTWSLYSERFGKKNHKYLLYNQFMLMFLFILKNSRNIPYI